MMYTVNLSSILPPSLSKFTILLLFMAAANLTALSQTEPQNEFLLNGTVTHNKLPLSDVNIVIQNSENGTKSDAFGNYALIVEIGDILQFSHLGYSTITIQIKSDKKIINLEMIPKANILEEALLKKVKRKNKILEERDKKFSTSKENINPRSVGYKTSYIKGDDIAIYNSVTSALLSRVPGYQVKSRDNVVQLGFLRNQPVLWDVDGRVTEVEPDLIMANIKDIRILGPSAAVNYGMQCKGLGGVGTIRSCGGVILIRMKKGIEDRRSLEEKNRINAILGNINNTNQREKFNSLYSETLRNIDDSDKAFTFCENVLERKKNEYHEDLQLMNVFYFYYDELELFQKLSDLFVTKYFENSHALKALAYELQALELNDASIKVYHTLLEQQKNEVQANRDLANAFIANNQFEKGLKFYLNRYKKDSKSTKKSIDKLIYNELEWLYYLKKSIFPPEESFEPKNGSKEAFGKDVRLVLEWNNPKASFIVNFRSNEKGTTIYEHNSDKTSSKKGYAIEEFVISALGNYNWNISMSYFGDQKQATYFKITCYYNWGRENQYAEIKTFLLNGAYHKAQLFSLSHKSLENK